MPHHLFYIHGLGSSPLSAKGTALRSAAENRGWMFNAPDFNQPHFSELTLSRVLSQSLAQLSKIPTGDTITLVGSSFGGLAATTLASMIAERKYDWCRKITGLVLLAPALYCHNFPSYRAVLPEWEREGSYRVWHTQEAKLLPLNWSFIADMRGHSEAPVVPASVPVLLFHGRNDTIVPISGSERWVHTQPNATLVALDTDHGMVDQLPSIVMSVVTFIAQRLQAENPT